MEISELLKSWISFLPRITLANIIEIFVISIILYVILTWISNTRARVLIKGLTYIVGVTFIAVIFEFNAILWVLSRIASIAVISLIIIFQPELRRALEQLGSKTGFLNKISLGKENKNEYSEEIIDEIARAAYSLSMTKTGALIVLEQGESLLEIAKTGISMGANVSFQLLVNIFEHNTPLHDGAVVVIDGKIAAATCYLPLSSNIHISKNLGTRHRAAIGLSENSDAVIVVVSEETGKISVANAGKLRQIKDSNELKKVLLELTITNIDEEDTPIRKLILWRGKRKNERKVD